MIAGASMEEINVNITINCCNEQTAKLENCKKTKQEIWQKIAEDPTMPCAETGKKYLK